MIRHTPGCPGADVHLTRGLTHSLVTCRACHAETRVTT